MFCYKILKNRIEVRLDSENREIIVGRGGAIEF